MIFIGEMAEWFKAHAWKVCVLSKVPRVRIPVSPPLSSKFYSKLEINLSKTYSIIRKVNERLNKKTKSSNTLVYVKII
jgi:hypothetical protein